MTFTITGIKSCPGGGHWLVSVKIDGKAVTEVCQSADLLAELAMLNPRERILARLRSYLLENNLTGAGNAGIRQALLNKEMQV